MYENYGGTFAKEHLPVRSDTTSARSDRTAGRFARTSGNCEGTVGSFAEISITCGIRSATGIRVRALRDKLVLREAFKTGKEKPAVFTAGFFYPGNDLLSHPVSRAVPSAQEGLTSVFGMGTGVSPPPWSPEITVIEKTAGNRNQNEQVGYMVKPHGRLVPVS